MSLRYAAKPDSNPLKGAASCAGLVDAFRRRIRGGTLLLGAALLALIWGAAELRSESARESGTPSLSRHTTMEVAELARQLASPRPDERRDAIVRLGRLGPKAASAIPEIM